MIRLRTGKPEGMETDEVNGKRWESCTWRRAPNQKIPGVVT